MGVDTKIAWTDHTFNPWWGCQRVSPGCEHCYAESFSKRVGLKVWGPTADRRFFGDKHWTEPHRWNLAAERAGVRRRVFCASMADVCEDRRDLDFWRLKLRALIEATPWLDWQLLSKRPENFVRLLWPGEWPKNAWAGCTVEDQKRADERLRHLRGVPASVRFVSHEPALELVDYGRHLMICRHWQTKDDIGQAPWCPPWPKHVWKPQALVGAGWRRPFDWLIIGGESGHGARLFDLSWGRNVIAQCKAAGVPVFFKQTGSNAMDSEHMIDAGGFGDVPMDFATDSHKGDVPSEWPEELRVREFPEVRS